jgi:hypothetical protein
MDSLKSTGRKPSPRADRAPERRRTRRNEPVARTLKAFYRPRPVCTVADLFEPEFVPGYN